MSIETWKKEFYPISANSKLLQKKGDVEKIKHSIKKWEGRLTKNLKKHNVFVDKDGLRHSVLCEKQRTARFDYNTDTCSLCVSVEFDNYNYGEEACEKCSIVKSGSKGCLEEDSAYYKVAMKGKSTVIMLNVLKKALKYAINEEKGLKKKK